MFVGGPGKNIFMYFSSDAGKGFIISVLLSQSGTGTRRRQRRDIPHSERR